MNRTGKHHHMSNLQRSYKQSLGHISYAASAEQVMRGVKGAAPVAHKGPELEAEEASADAHEHIRQQASLSIGWRPSDRQRCWVPRHVRGSRREAER